MRVQRIGFTLEQLRSIPDAERSLIVVLAHALNEINTLHRLLFLSTRFDLGSGWIDAGKTAQSLTLVRPLVGKLNEAWEVVRKGYFGTKLAKKYNQRLEPSALEALNNLKLYFGRTNVVSQIRNNFGFHYSLEHAKSNVPDAASPDELAIYLHDTSWNSLYLFAESIMNTALIESISPSNPEEAFRILLGEMFNVTTQLNELVQGLMFVVFDEFIGEEVIRQSVQTVDLGEVPKSDEIHIPIFLEIIKPSAKNS